MNKIIGIDLGTTNSAIAVMEGGTPKIITNEEGTRTTPSVVAFTKDGERLVGISARRQAIVNPENTIYSAKRFIGARFDEVKKEAAAVSYGIVSDGATCKIEAGAKRYSVPEVSAQVLRKLKRDAEKYLGHEVTEAVITVPAYFNDTQRQATKDAGKIAGLEVRRIINEPTAAALAYGFDKGEDQVIAVFDLGGGTFDISILEVSEDVVEVLSTNGDTHLGGDDIDHILIAWLVSAFKADTGIDISQDKTSLQRLRDAAEKAKIELSSAQQTEINLPFLTADASGPKHLAISLSRAKFEQMIDRFIKSTLVPAKNALKDAKLTVEQIDEVLLVGGSTRIPAVQAAVEKFFGKSPNNTVNPDEVVALGAAIQGGVFTGDVTDMLLLDVTPLSLGIETLGGVMTTLISRNTTIPAAKSEVFSTAEDNQGAVTVHVLQGERQFSKDNRTLGMFNLDGIPPARRGMPQIEVKFDIDANGIVSVSATDKVSGKSQSVTITEGGTLSEAEIEKMVNDAEANEEEDKLKRQIIEQRNKLDSLIYQAQKLQSEHPDTQLEDEIATAQEVIDTDDLDALSSAFSNLETALHAAATCAYQQQAEAPHDDKGDASEHSVETDDIVDAEYEEVSP